MYGLFLMYEADQYDCEQFLCSSNSKELLEKQLLIEMDRINKEYGDPKYSRSYHKKIEDFKIEEIVFLE